VKYSYRSTYTGFVYLRLCLRKCLIGFSRYNNTLLWYNNIRPNLPPIIHGRFLLRDFSFINYRRVFNGFRSTPVDRSTGGWPRNVAAGILDPENRLIVWREIAGGRDRTSSCAYWRRPEPPRYLKDRSWHGHLGSVKTSFDFRLRD